VYSVVGYLTCPCPTSKYSHTSWVFIPLMVKLPSAATNGETPA
jgi:hypothetical protein